MNASDEPRGDVDFDPPLHYVRCESSALARITEAVLAEVARRNAGEQSSYDEGCSEYELAVVNASFYVREAMRLKAEGTTHSPPTGEKP